MIFGLLVAFIGAAQETFVVFEGAESTYFVNEHTGSIYTWNVYVGFNPDTEASSDNYEFTTVNGTSQIGIYWQKAGVYYLDVTETDIFGCNNRKVIAVNVVPANQSIAFESIASSACYNLDNSFSLNIQCFEGEGNLLDESKFPVNTEMNINGSVYSFQINYDNQSVTIPNSLITLNSDVNTQIEIKIINAQDAGGQTLELINGRSDHMRTIFAFPEIEFIFSDNIVDKSSNGVYKVNMNYGNSNDALYNWWIEPSNGSSTNLESISTSEANILWDGPIGNYSLYVSAIDGNGCYSDTINVPVEVRKSDTPFEVYAGADTVIGSCDFYLFADVYPTDDLYTYSWEPSIYLDGPDSPHPLFVPGETTTYVLTVTSQEGISVKDTITITVEDIYADAGDDVYMESGSTVILDGSRSVGAGIDYKWTSSTGSIESGADTPYPVVSDFGTYYLEVTYEDFNCISVDSVKVNRLAHAPIANDDYDTTNYMTEIKIPVLDNDFDEENSIDSTSLMITIPPYSGNAYVDYDDFTIHYQSIKGFNGNDNFEYQICNEFDNCDKANVYVWVTDFEFLIPEAFSPNGDGINDYFEILGIEYYENNSITIINRAGIKVYEAKNYGISSDPIFWDGKSNTGFRIGNEGLPTGTYFYILRLGNGEKPISGSIYLDR